MGNKAFPRKTFGLQNVDQEPYVDEAIAALTPTLPTDKITLPKGYFLPAPSRESVTVDSVTTTYVGATCLGSEVWGNSACVSKKDKSGNILARSWKVNMPGFIYRSHEGGNWNPAFSGITVFVSNNNTFTHNPSLGKYVSILYTQEELTEVMYKSASSSVAGPSDKHGNAMFPIFPGTSTYIMISTGITLPGRETAYDDAPENNDIETRKVYFIPAYHYGNNATFDSDIDKPIVLQTFEGNTTGYIQVPKNISEILSDTNNVDYFKKCFAI